MIMYMTSDIAQQVELLGSNMQCDGTNRMQQCTGQAKYVVAVHVLDNCKSSPRYTGNGEHVSVLCADCTRTVVATVAKNYQRFTVLLTPGFALKCETCQKAFRRLADFLTVEHV